MKEKTMKFLKSNSLFAFLLNSAILIFCIHISSFSYDTIKDFYDSINICQQHFYYDNVINYFLATLIGSAQFVLNNFNAFVLALVMMSYFAFTSITYVLADKFGKISSLIISLLINILFALNHYADIQATKTAAILYVAGFLLVLNAIRNKRYNLTCWIGITEILFASFLNYLYFYIALLFAIAFFISETIVKGKYKIKFRKFFWFFRPFVLLFVLITAVVICGYQYTYSVNNSSFEASQYYEYCELTDSIERYLLPNYEEYQDEFINIGLNENDYHLLKNGYYDEATSLNLESLKLVNDIQIKESNKTIIGSFVEIFTDLFGHIVSFDYTTVLLIVSIILTICFVISHKRKLTLYPLLYFIVALVSSTSIRFFFDNSFYFIYGLWVMYIVLLIYSINPEEFAKEQHKSISFKSKNKIFTSKRSLVVAFMSLLVVFSMYSVVYITHLPEPTKRKKPSSLYTEIERHPECYFVFDPDTYLDYLKFTDNYIHPLWGFKRSYLTNTDSFGFIHNEKQLIKRTLTSNIYNAILTNKKIYVIDNTMTFRKEKYLKNHYAKNDNSVTYVQQKQINGFKIYSVETD